jgi:ElaB/YqjD/DUF883 family membrane-anchored ribosome-binding protein
MAQAVFDAGREVKDDLDSLRSDLDALRRDFDNLVSKLDDNAGSRNSDLDALREDFRNLVSTLARSLQTTGQQQLRGAERRIEEQPLMSVAIAFVTGLVAARLRG